MTNSWHNTEIHRVCAKKSKYEKKHTILPIIFNTAVITNSLKLASTCLQNTRHYNNDCFRKNDTHVNPAKNITSVLMATGNSWLGIFLFFLYVVISLERHRNSKRSSCISTAAADWWFITEHHFLFSVLMPSLCLHVLYWISFLKIWINLSTVSQNDSLAGAMTCFN